MITQADIEKNEEDFPEQGRYPSIVQGVIEYGEEVSVTKKDLDDLKIEMKSVFSSLQASVDKFGISADRHDKEIKVANHRLHKLENPA